MENLDNMWGFLFVPAAEEPEDQQGLFNSSELAQSISACGEELEPLIDKMLITLMVSASQALSTGLTFAWTRCPANESTLQVPDSMPPSSMLDYAIFKRPSLVNFTPFSFVSQWSIVQPTNIFKMCFQHIPNPFCRHWCVGSAKRLLSPSMETRSNTFIR